MNKVIEFDKVYFGYNSEHILKNISFFVNEGDFVSIIGSNGAGKSTILKLMIGEINQSKGNIKIYKEDIKKFNDWHYIGYLEQNAYYKILNFPATVYEVIMSNLFLILDFLNFQIKIIALKLLKRLNFLTWKNIQIE